jgi:hypothetical protein
MGSVKEVKRLGLDGALKLGVSTLKSEFKLADLPLIQISRTPKKRID